MRMALGGLAAITYAGLSLLAAFYAFIAAVGGDGTAAYDPEAWQWDALAYLGLASILPTLAMLVLVADRRRIWWAAATLVVHVAVLVSIAIILIDGEIVDASPVIWVLVLVAASGAALVATRASSRADAPGTRAGRSA